MDIVTVGVVSDTHIPDRARELHPALLPALRSAGVGHILHAGDIAIPSVLTQLEQVAPVTAVRGNRDWLLRSRLPWMKSLEFAGVPLVLIHGQGNLRQYVMDKWFFLIQGYRLKRYQNIMERHIHTARVIVFGHTHVVENLTQDGKLWFNPGSASIPMRLSDTPSFGLLHFSSGQVSGEIIPLSGYRLQQRSWVKWESVLASGPVRGENK